MEKIISSLEELETFASGLVAELSPLPTEATLVTLSGELGAGKTAFTKAVAKTLGIEEVVTSPTFVLEKIYGLPATASFSRLVHIDAYRLSSGAELAPLGFDELMKNSGNLILLEWPEKVSGALPAPALHITLSVREDGSRHIIYGT